MHADGLSHENPAQRGRQQLMRVCAQATADELAAALARLEPTPTYEMMRAPEIGLVMLRGRIGGDGAPFNFGEATVSRAVVRLRTGEIGFGWRLGRALEAVRAGAIIDALWQSPAWRDRVVDEVLNPLGLRQQRDRDRADEQAAATKVDFFTMARGGD